MTSPPPPRIPGIADAFALDPKVTYLNHGSFGACPLPVLEVQREIQARLEREPYRFFMREAETLILAAREELASFVGADPDGLAFVPNATHGVNTVLRSLDFAPGDELLTTNHEYNACKNALDYVAERTGATVVVAPLPFPAHDEERLVAPILERVTPRTRLALLDHVTSQTALVFPIARLVRELRARGVETLVDGAHAVGMLPLDLISLGAAYFTSNCHKWLCAPKGCAFLYVREDLRTRIVPLSISHGRNTVHPTRSRFRLLFDWTGTDDPSAYLSVPAALRFLGGALPDGGAHALAQRNHALVVWGRAEVARALGVPIPAPDAMLGTMASLPLPGAVGGTSPFEVDPLQAALIDRFGIETPVLTWPGEAGERRRALRISAQAYNEPAHYEALASALRQLV
jgi:isopenicillin-N epimerase